MKFIVLARNKFNEKVFFSAHHGWTSRKDKASQFDSKKDALLRIASELNGILKVQIRRSR